MFVMMYVCVCTEMCFMVFLYRGVVWSAAAVCVCGLHCAVRDVMWCVMQCDVAPVALSLLSASNDDQMCPVQSTAWAVTNDNVLLCVQLQLLLYLTELHSDDDDDDDDAVVFWVMNITCLLL